MNIFIMRLLSEDNGRKVSDKQPTSEIIYGSDKVIDRLVQFMRDAQHRIDVCVDDSQPLLAIEFKQIRDAFIDAKGCNNKVHYRNYNK